MGLFGASFEEKVQQAVAAVSGLGLGVKGLEAKVAGKLVTLSGEAPSLAAKTKVMAEFTARVECENVVNTIRVVAPSVPVAPKEEPPRPAEEEIRWHVVAANETLGGLARRYYGKASLYTRIFEANRDVLKDPNLIKVGQKLRIPN